MARPGTPRGWNSGIAAPAARRPLVCMEPLVAPARGLGRQPQDRVAADGRQRGRPGRRRRPKAAPPPSDQLALPAPESLGPNRERLPVGAREALAEGRVPQAVARAPGDPRGAAVQVPYFRAPGEKLEVPGRHAPAAEQGEVEEQVDGGMHERWQQRQPPGTIVPSEPIRSSPAHGNSAPDWRLIVGARHLEHGLREYVVHHDAARPHRALGLQAPLARGQPAPPKSRSDQVVRRDRLGRLIHEHATLVA